MSGIGASSSVNIKRKEMTSKYDNSVSFYNFALILRIFYDICRIKIPEQCLFSWSPKCEKPLNVETSFATRGSNYNYNYCIVGISEAYFSQFVQHPEGRRRSKINFLIRHNSRWNLSSFYGVIRANNSSGARIIPFRDVGLKLRTRLV